MKKTQKIASFLAAGAMMATALAAFPRANTSADNVVDVEINVPEYLTLVLSSDMMNFGDVEAENLYEQSITVTAGTNGGDGYTVSFGSENGYNELKHINEHFDTVIPSITSNATAANFPALGWGYTADTTNKTYHAIPVESDNIYITDTNGTNEHTFTAASKVNDEIIAGKYTNSLVFTIVSNSPITISPADPGAYN